MNRPRPQYTAEFLTVIDRHLVEIHGQQLGVKSWNLSGGADPRFTGHAHHGGTASVDLRTVGYQNAAQYRGWLTLSPGQVRAMSSERPAGWRFYVLMIGLLPDGAPWWSALWDLTEPARLLNVMTEIPMPSGGSFYRVCPGDLPVHSRPAVYDFIQQDLGLATIDLRAVGADEEPEPDIIRRIESWESSIPQTSDAELAKVDQVMLRVRRMIRSERERRG